MQILGREPAALTTKDLLEKYSDKFRSFIRREVEGDIELERICQVMRALKCIEYWNGNQYVAPELDEDTGEISINGVDASKTGRQRFSVVYNIYKSDGQRFVGAVSSRAPNCKAVADDIDDTELEGRSKEANGLLIRQFEKWDVDSKQKELGYNAWNTGPTFAYTPFVSDGHKYGYQEIPKVELVEDPATGVPVPQVTGKTKYPNGDVELHLLDCRYVTIPFRAKAIDECEYLKYWYLEHKAVLKKKYGKALDEDRIGQRDGLEGAKDAEATAQEAANNPSGRRRDAWRDNRWRYERYWIRPVYYTLIEGTVEGRGGDMLDDDGEPIKLSDQLEEQFPDGLRIDCVNGVPVKFEHERMDHLWSACKPGTGQRILEKSWGDSVIPIQDDLNDLANMAKENVLRHNVVVAHDSELFDRETLKELDNIIHGFMPCRLGTGQDISKLLTAIPTAQMPKDLVGLMQFLAMVLRRDIDGVTEALAGTGQPASTYRAEKQRRDQSMMQFAPFFNETQKFWEAVGENAIRQLAKYGNGRVKVPGENGDGSIEVDLALLAEEGVHVEAEEQMPMSFAEEADAARYLTSTEANPQVANQLELYAPQNIGRFQSLLGLRGFTSSLDDARRKVNKIIQRLLTEAPIMDIDPVTQQPLPARPSIEPEEGIDDYPTMAQLGRVWCNGPQGLRAKETNQAGYDNVAAWVKAEQAIADAMMAPPPGAPGDAGGGEPPAAGGPPPQGGPPAPGGIPQSPEPFDTAPPQY